MYFSLLLTSIFQTFGNKHFGKRKNTEVFCVCFVFGFVFTKYDEDVFLSASAITKCAGFFVSGEHKIAENT